MTIAKISNTGLCVTGILVFVLWGIVVTNWLTLYGAQLEATRVMREIKSLQIQKKPKSPSGKPAVRRARLRLVT